MRFQAWTTSWPKVFVRHIYDIAPIRRILFWQKCSSDAGLDWSKRVELCTMDCRKSKLWCCTYKKKYTFVTSVQQDARQWQLRNRINRLLSTRCIYLAMSICHCCYKYTIYVVLGLCWMTRRRHHIFLLDVTLYLSALQGFGNKNVRVATLLLNEAYCELPVIVSGHCKARRIAMRALVGGLMQYAIETHTSLWEPAQHSVHESAPRLRPWINVRPLFEVDLHISTDRLNRQNGSIYDTLKKALSAFYSERSNHMPLRRNHGTEN